MYYIKYYAGLAWVWLVNSSADPSKYSMAVKFALLGLVPYVLQATALACGFGLPHGCITLDQNALAAVVEALSNIVFWVLSILSALGFVYGFIRKLYRTAVGTNVATGVYIASRG